MIDFTLHPALESFPWELVHHGLAISEKTVGTFNVGEIQKFGLENVKYSMRPSDKRWYLGLKHGFPIEGFNVNVTEPTISPVPWFQTSVSKYWKPANNYKNFLALIEWIESSKLFKSTGRILFFICLPGEAAPPHVDFVHNGKDIPEGFKIPDFIWITPPNNAKILKVEGQPMPWACNFNPMLTHETVASSKTQWSLRIDGEFA